MIHIGFTGTQRGMTKAQADTVMHLLFGLGDREFIAHHGDCLDADAQFDALVRLGPGFRGVVLHPPDIDAKRAFIDRHLPCIEVRPARPYLERNEHIVFASNAMIATPKENHMTTRSGTWATVRRAIAFHSPLAIVLTGGGVAWDGPQWPWPTWI